MAKQIMIWGLALASSAVEADAGACRASAESDMARRVALLELYTSEGCSSCPPADAWLRGLSAAGWDGRKVAPLAFHVDYWDGLGWRDRFADPAYSQRQRWRAAQAGSDLVYTPQVLLNGRDWRAWGYDSLRASLPAGRSPVSLRLDIRAAGDGIDVDAVVKREASAPSLRLMLALYENGLQSQVAAGENAGRALRHAVVVRRLDGPYALSGAAALGRHLRFAAGQKVGQSGVVAWLEDESGQVWQAAMAACPGG
ncbi:thioredoxin family protein [Chromobacterium sp. IIBBL 290-4]|uniref:DUF1223 domain-containing protein n=1 Tax=Chromobacterium sp. IIBBL 290-4 TaxID=2953890 RepID=UPI0020B8E839|nr:DUF1223 domain-containing protein [Chromobacterium sp. IIBBL 290-4]UTH72334.1 DUF1223 domain-containing protein [Chromobacterium sp. IIBBL 290-4]